MTKQGLETINVEGLEQSGQDWRDIKRQKILGGSFGAMVLSDRVMLICHRWLSCISQSFQDDTFKHYVRLQ